MAEANKYAAGEWKKARKPEGLLQQLASLPDVVVENPAIGMSRTFNRMIAALSGWKG
jgi:hypothetical protein